MNREEFNNLIKQSDKTYQVYIFASRMPFPFSVFLHTWIVLVDHEDVSRYDVWGWKKRCETSWGHLHLNLYEPWIGVRKFPSKNSNPNASRSKSFVLNSIVGAENSLAQKVVDFLKKGQPSYPYINLYKYFPGPNSNTFTQWVLDEFPELNFRLPWTAVGKNFKNKAGRQFITSTQQVDQAL